MVSADSDGEEASDTENLLIVDGNDMVMTTTFLRVLDDEEIAELVEQVTESNESDDAEINKLKSFKQMEEGDIDAYDVALTLVFINGDGTVIYEHTDTYEDLLAEYGDVELDEEADSSSSSSGESTGAEAAESADSSAESAGTESADCEEEQDATVTTKTFQLGNSSYTIELPESYGEGELSEKDVKNDMVAYMKSPDYGMDFCVYQFSNEGLPEDLGKVAIMEAKDYNTTEVKTDVMINGMNVPYIRCIQPFEGKDYNTITYYLDGGDTIIEVEFWLFGDYAEEISDMIISTLSSAQN